MNRRRQWGVGTLIALAVGAGLLWMDREERIGVGPAEDTDVLRPDPDRLEAAQPATPTLEGRRATEEAAEDAPTRWERLIAPAGNGPYVVRGVVLRGFDAMAPGARVIGSAFAGSDRKGKLLTRVALRADKSGWFAWAMTAPERAMYLHFELVEASTFVMEGTGVIITPDTPPPPHVTLYLLPPDARIVGRVMDEQGKPLPDAVILRSSRSKPTPCNAEGRYEIAATSATDDTSLTARAPGFAIARATISIPKADAVVTHDFKLHPEFRVFGRITDPNGRPLKGAVVKSFQTSYWDQAVTDENGLYELGHLSAAPAKLSVFARHPEFTESMSWIRPSGEKQEVNLQLGRGAAFAGYVMDSEGRGLGGARLYLGFSESAYNRLDATSEENGYFAFPVVAPGTYTLAVEHPGFAPHKQQETVPLGSTARATSVTLQAGRRVAGRIVDPSGQPVGGMRISLRHQDHYVGSSHRTDGDGRFEIHNAPFHDTQLWAFKVGYERLKDPLNGDTSSLRLVVQRAGRLAGVVLDGETGKPVSSFVIRFIEPDLADGERRGWDYGASWTSPGHRFENNDGVWDTGGENLPRGTLFGIEVTAEGYAPGYNRHVVAVVDPEASATTIRLSRGATVTGKVLDEATGAAVPGAVVKIGPSDRAPTQAAFDLWDAAANAMRTKTDAKGTFRIAAVRIGWIRLLVEHEDYAETLHGPVRVSKGTFDTGAIRLGKGATVRGRVADDKGTPSAGATVVLMAVLEGERGVLMRTGPTRRAQTDESGRYAFDKVRAGTYRLQRLLALPGGKRTGGYVVRLEVRDGDQEIPLAPVGNATIKGTVALLVGAPAGLIVRLFPVDGLPSGLPQRATPLVDGTFTFARVEAGSYKVSCGYSTPTKGSAHVYREGSAKIEVPGGATVQVALEID